MARYRLILASVFAFAALACGRADATLCTIPYTFSTGSTIQAAPFNSNFSALQTCANNIDNSNIGSAGLYASNLLPTTTGQATFGGSQTYSFPSQVIAASFAAGSSTYGATSATVAGPLSATTGSFGSGLVVSGADNVNSPYGGAWIGWSQRLGVLGGETDFDNEKGLVGSGGWVWSNVTASNVATTVATLTSAGNFSTTGSVSGTTGSFSGAVSGTTGSFSGAVSGTTLSPTAGTLTAIGWGSCVTTPNCALGLNVAMYNTSYRCQLTVNNAGPGPSTVFAYAVVSTSTIGVYGPTGYTIQALCYE